MRFDRSSASAPLRSKATLKNNWRASGLFGSSDFGDDPDDAEQVGRLKRRTSYNYSGDVGGEDLDFFEFQVRQKRSPFSLTLRNEAGNDEPIAVSILNKRGRVVKRGGNFLFANIGVGETGSISTARLRKGKFYIRVQSEEGRNEDYELGFALSTTSTLPIDDDNLFDIGSLSPGEQFSDSGSVGGSDIDYYRFSVDDTSRVAASLFNNSFSSFTEDSIAFSILDDDRRTVQVDSGRFLFANVAPRQEATLFAPTLPSGEYYLRVQSDLGQNLNYSLALSRSDLLVAPL